MSKPSSRRSAGQSTSSHRRPSSSRPSSARSAEARKRKRRRSRTKKLLAFSAIAVLCVGAFVLIAGGTYLLALLGKVNFINPGDESHDYSQVGDELNPEDSDVQVYDPVDINDLAQSVSDIAVQRNTKAVTNILLLGVETENKNNYSGRADTMLIVSIDKSQKSIKLISLLRDTYVTVPNHTDRYKLNAAYTMGGFNLLRDTIEANFRLHIDQFIAVNFNAFAKLVDALDGIDVTMTAKEAKACKLNPAAGTYHLNGEKALFFSRIRKIDDDFGRTTRQRIVIQAIMTKAKTMNKAELLSFMNSALEVVYTNMKRTDFLSYVLSAGTYLNYTTTEYYLPQRGTYDDPRVLIPGTTDHMQVLELLDPKASVLALHHQIYG